MAKDKNYHRDGADFLVVNRRIIPVIGTIDAQTGDVEFDTRSKKEHIARITDYGHKAERKSISGPVVDVNPSTSQPD